LAAKVDLRRFLVHKISILWVVRCYLKKVDDIGDVKVPQVDPITIWNSCSAL
jgi:hypothetical protein